MDDTPTFAADESVTFNVPERMKWLGEELKPVLEELMGRMEDQGPVVPLPNPPFLDAVLEIFDRLKKAAPRLTAAVERLEAEVVARETATRDTVRAAAASLEEAIAPFRIGLVDARRFAAGNGDVNGWELVAAMHEHSLGEIRRWMADLVEVTLDPEGFVARRGLSVGVTIPVELRLTLTEWPRMDELLAWAEARSRATGQAFARPAGLRGPGLFTLILAALGLAHLFGCGGDD